MACINEILFGLKWFLDLFTSDRVIAIATVGYLVVTFIMFYEIRLQGKNSTKQLRLLERQVGLQGATFRQWVTVDKDTWKAKPALWEGTWSVTFNFVIANKTNFPLTIRDVCIEIDGTKSGDGHDYYLGPGEDIPISHWMELLADKAETYEAGGPIFISIGLKITYIDCLKQHAPYSKGIACTLIRDRPATFEFYASTEGGKEKETNQDKKV